MGFVGRDKATQASPEFFGFAQERGIARGGVSGEFGRCEYNKKNLTALLNQANDEAVAIHKHPRAYLVPAEKYELFMERLENYELGDIVKGNQKKHMPLKLSWMTYKLKFPSFPCAAHNNIVMENHDRHTDVIIIGAGASGLMCAIEAGKRGRKVLVLDHANKAGKKILMSGGGRCNFTNYSIEPDNYISHNPHFCKSALSRYTQWDFLALIGRYQIPFHERDQGQLFCNESSRDILDMLLAECDKVGVVVQLSTSIDSVERLANRFHLKTSHGSFTCQSLVVATGGLSIPKMGATPLGYKIAQQFGINVLPTSAGLVPFTLQPEDKEKFSALSGIAVPCVVSNKRQSFSENVLFTHRGLSGPAILQISSYWCAGEEIVINLLPQVNLEAELKSKRQQKIKNKLKTILEGYLPKRLISVFLLEDLLDLSLQNLSDKQIQLIADQIHNWKIKPNGTEGYRTAEVTSGGVDCDAVSSKTMESKQVHGLYFIGEVLDVTGWLGGYNFQWAWSSAWCGGQYC